MSSIPPVAANPQQSSPGFWQATLSNFIAGALLWLVTGSWWWSMRPFGWWMPIFGFVLLVAVPFVIYLLRGRLPVAVSSIATVVIAGLWLLGFGFAAGKAIPAGAPNAPLRQIIGQTYVNTRVPLDGNAYIACNFDNVTFEWNGTAPFDVRASHKSCCNRFETQNPQFVVLIDLIKAFGFLTEDFAASWTHLGPEYFVNQPAGLSSPGGTPAVSSGPPAAVSPDRWRLASTHDSTIAAAISRFSQSARAHIFFPRDHAGATLLAEDIARALRTGGWTVEVRPAVGNQIGIGVSVDPLSEPSDAVFRALLGAGLPIAKIEAAAGSVAASGEVQIAVGDRP